MPTTWNFTTPLPAQPTEEDWEREDTESELLESIGIPNDDHDHWEP